LVEIAFGASALHRGTIARGTARVDRWRRATEPNRKDAQTKTANGKAIGG
jgi:hypothetical protein